MTAEIVQFPPRARPRAAHAPARAEAVKWFDEGAQRWVVDAIAAGGDSEARLGEYIFENEADARVILWNDEHGHAPDGAA